MRQGAPPARPAPHPHAQSAGHRLGRNGRRNRPGERVIDLERGEAVALRASTTTATPDPLLRNWMARALANPGATVSRCTGNAYEGIALLMAVVVGHRIRTTRTTRRPREFTYPPQAVRGGRVAAGAGWRLAATRLRERRRLQTGSEAGRRPQGAGRRRSARPDPRFQGQCPAEEHGAVP